MCGSVNVIILILTLIASAVIQPVVTVPTNSGSDILLKEVLYGGTVVLNCRSNDVDHFFDYWIIDNKGLIIGPSNEHYDNGKFKYEILSGNLTIRGISDQEEGIYSCVSRQVTGGNHIRIEKVKIHVLKDWEDVYEHDSDINTIRIIIVLITLVLVSIGAYVIYRIWRERYIYPNYLAQVEDEDEDSTEEIFRTPGTSGIRRSTSPGRIVLSKAKSEPFEDLSTDFKSILDTVNDK